MTRHCSFDINNNMIQQSLPLELMVITTLMSTPIIEGNMYKFHSSSSMVISITSIWLCLPLWHQWKRVVLSLGLLPLPEISLGLLPLPRCLDIPLNNISPFEQGISLWCNAEDILLMLPLEPCLHLCEQFSPWNHGNNNESPYGYVSPYLRYNMSNILPLQYTTPQPEHRSISLSMMILGHVHASTRAIPYIMKQNICQQWNGESWKKYQPSTSCAILCANHAQHPCKSIMYILCHIIYHTISSMECINHMPRTCDNCVPTIFLYQHANHVPQTSFISLVIYLYHEPSASTMHQT